MKNCSAELLEHIRGSATTMCGLLRIGPLPDDTYICLTSLDKDISYDPDDGSGELTFYAHTGFQSSNLASSSDLGVDNAIADTLVPVFPNTNGITVDQVERGELDGLLFDIFSVNYSDLSMGHIHWASGLLGEQIVTHGGLLKLELRSWSQLMKQNSVVRYYSRTCITQFGSQYPDSLTPGPKDRHPCTYDAESEWVSFDVIAVGGEVVRQFTIAADSSTPLEEEENYYAPGKVIFETGDNAGQDIEIESYSEDGEVSLLLTARNPIQIGDTGRIRRQCTKWWSGHNSCQTFDNRPFFRGQPYIPVGDQLILNVPGVAGGGNSGVGTGEVSPE